MTDVLTPKEIKDLGDLFVRFDGDSNGELDVDELKDLINYLKIMTSTEDLQILIDTLDVDGNGTIDCNELMSTMDKTILETYREEEIRECFSSLVGADESADEPNDRISFRDLAKSMSAAGAFMTEGDVKDLLAEVDESGDGVIDYHEFRNILLHY